jgi:formylglycine-generating enzyme required for sulfatase activity
MLAGQGLLKVVALNNNSSMHTYPLNRLVLLFLIFSVPVTGLTAFPKERDGMVFVKGGCFEMGSPLSQRMPDEEPKRRVCLDDFWIDKYEVTQKQFTDIMGRNPSRFRGCDNCPVENVSWFKATAHCSFIGKRLPTEAEWEYAATEGGGKVKYGFGKNSINNKKANYNGKKPKPVGGYRPNSLDLYDMTGNVKEWVFDWYDADYYSVSPLNNPEGPATGKLKVLRGGYWGDSPKNLRAASRDKAKPASRHFENGFRCARSEKNN